MNKINLPTKSPTLSQVKTNTSTEKVTSLKNTGPVKTVANKESLKIASAKASNVNKKPTLEDKIQNVLSNGANYFKQVSKTAREDRAKGVGTLEGANNLWKQLSAQADKIGQKAQDKVIDNFVKESGELITESLKDTQVGDLLSGVIGSTNKAVTTTTSAGSAASSTTAANGASSAGATTATSSVANTVIGGVGAAYSLYQLYDTFGKSSPVEGAMNGATVGAYVGSCICPGIGTAIGGVIGGIAGAALGLINNRKHPERVQRDQMRDALTQFGFIDKDHNIKLADGTSYSLGTDSKHTLANVDGTKRFGYQIDFSNPLAGKAIALAQPLAEALTGGHDKLKTDLVGYLANAATSNASSEEEVKANVLAFYKQSGLSEEALATSLGKLTEENKISKEEIQVYANDLSSLFSDSENSENQDIKKAA